MLNSIKLLPLALTVIAAGAFFSLSGCGGTSSSSAGPTARYVYVGGEGSTVQQYSVGADGGLVPLTPPTIAEGDNVRGFAKTADGKYLYASTDNGIKQWSVGANGQLTSLSPASVANNGSDYGIIVRGDNLYCDSFGEFAHYKIGSDGTLTFVATYNDTGANQFAITPNGQSLYTGVNNALWQYTINANGSLTPKTVPSISTPTLRQTYAVVVNAAGTYAYVSDDFDNSVKQFSIGSNGELTPLSPLSTAALPTSISNVYQLLLDQNGNLHQMNYTNPGVIRTFTPGGGGLLGAGVDFTTANIQPWIGMVSSQNRLYSLDYTAAVVSAYNLSSTGAKTLVGTYPCGTDPTAIIEVLK
jgi:hypothetical protein